MLGASIDLRPSPGSEEPSQLFLHVSLVETLFTKTVGDKDCPLGVLLRWQNYCTRSTGAMEVYIVLFFPSRYLLSNRLKVARMKMHYLIMLICMEKVTCCPTCTRGCI